MLSADEMAAVTTMVSGSVKITAAQKTVILKTGQQSVQQNKNTANKNGSRSISSFVAWKDEIVLCLVSKWT